MNIIMRDKSGKLRSKDILFVDLDMEVEPKDDKYVLRINRNYILDEDFPTEAAAEERLIQLAEARNNIENEYRNDS